MTTNGAEKEKANGGAGKEKHKKIAAGAAPLKVSSKLKLLQEVIALMGEAQINEILFEQSGVKIHLRKGLGPPLEVPMSSVPASPVSYPVVSTAVASSAPASVSSAVSGANPDGTLTVTAPMVGTFYRQPAPDAKAFIQEGGRLEVGQVFCIIEAMKLMNEIKSEVSGKVLKVLAENGQAVEFGQPVLVVDPN